MINLGVRAHDFGKLPLDELAGKIAAHQLNCVQFAATKAMAGFDEDAGRLNPGLAVHARDSFARHGIRIAVLGCYINLADPDEKTRRFHLARFKAHLRYARDFGCSVVGTETGSLHADFSWHPDNHGEDAYQRVAEGVQELIDEAEKFGVLVCIEGVERYVMHSPQTLKRLIDDVESNNLQIIFDPVNLLNAKNYEQQDAIMEEAFDLFGERIAIVHVKDFTMANGEFRPQASGTPGGQLNLSLLCRLIKQHKPWVQVLLEDTHPDTIARSAHHVREVYASA